MGYLSIRDIEKNSMNVNDMIKPLGGLIALRIMKRVTLGRNSMNVNSVGKPSRVSVLFRYMKECTME
jgi:hypothetical protein